jgi:hypothetical protein
LIVPAQWPQVMSSTRSVNPPPVGTVVFVETSLW